MGGLPIGGHQGPSMDELFWHSLQLDTRQMDGRSYSAPAFHL